MPLGQGLLRGRGLPEDRPARPRDALGGRALRRGDRAHAPRADRPLAHPVRRRRRPTSAIQAADTMGVFQIESRAQMQSLLRTRPETSTTSRSRSRSCARARSSAARSTRTSSASRSCATNPDYEVPYDHPSLEPVLKDTLGTIIFQDQVLEVAMAFAGFSPGEAEGLRRAMSRKRSAAAIEAYHERFVAGAARTHGADRETAERVFTMIAGFSGFGFPKAHGAAFGLLAYQSTWLRVHYKPEFTCALLNEQPMGFYPSDTLVHEAQRTGIEVLAPDVNHSRVLCHVERGRRRRGDRADPHRPRATSTARARTRWRRSSPSARPTARSARWASWRRASGAGRPALSILAWSGRVRLADRRPHRAGAADRAVAARRRGAGDQGRRRAPQLALPLELPDAPALKPLEAWERMVADYATTGLTAGAHPMALAARGAAAGHRHLGRPAAAAPRRPRADRRPGGRPPAPGDRQRDRLHAARGRVRDDQPRRPAARLRARPARRPRRAAGVRRGPPREAPQGGGGDQHRRRLPAPAGRAARHRGRRRSSRCCPRPARAEATTSWPTARRRSRGSPAAAAAGAGGARSFAAVAPPVQSFASGRRR